MFQILCESALLKIQLQILSNASHWILKSEKK